MIYRAPSSTDPIRQGDIFVGLRRPELSLNALIVYDEDGKTREQKLEDLSSSSPDVIALIPLKPTIGIVISQDCDAVHAPYLSLCEVRPFSEVFPQAKEARKPETWVKLLTQKARLVLKWYYLPEDKTCGIPDRMGADFMCPFSLPRLDLEQRRASLRIARLGDEAVQHFRERLSEFYGRFAYDEWYPLSKAEFAVYKREYPEVEPRPHQV